MNLAFDQQIQPLVGNALYSEYESVLGRDELFKKCPFDAEKRNLLLDDFLSTCNWIEIHYTWRPNLWDEGDNHVVELALSGQAKYVVTQNERDFKRGDLMFPELEVLGPREFLNFYRGRNQWLS